MPDDTFDVYVASADKTNSTGLYRYHVNARSGELRLAGASADIHQGLYVAFHSELPILYVTGTFKGEAHIHSLRIQPNGELTLINRQPTDGHEPCYVALTTHNTHALVVNYAGPTGAGSVLTFPIHEDGQLLPHKTQLNLSGKSINPQRQDAAHPHMIHTTPDDRFILVPDLGTDKVMIYRLDPETGLLQPHAQPFIAIQEGSGPRHVAFHPTQPVIYVISELLPILSVVTYDANGRFTVVGTHPTLPDDVAGTIHHQGADVHVTQSGQFLYASNRGHNSIACYSVDPSGIQLNAIGYQSTAGDWPRSFALAPKSQLMIVANQHSDDLQSFFVDQSTGRLTATGHKVTVPGPVCVACLQ